jgi:hypothetical protein
VTFRHLEVVRVSRGRASQTGPQRDGDGDGDGARRISIRQAGYILTLSSKSASAL